MGTARPVLTPGYLGWARPAVAGLPPPPTSTACVRVILAVAVKSGDGWEMACGRQQADVLGICSVRSQGRRAAPRGTFRGGGSRFIATRFKVNVAFSYVLKTVKTHSPAQREKSNGSKLTRLVKNSSRDARFNTSQGFPNILCPPGWGPLPAPAEMLRDTVRSSGDRKHLGTWGLPPRVI